MLKFSSWMHPGLKLKRWIFLLTASIVILAIGLSGQMGHSFRGFRLDLVNPKSMERLARQVQTLRFVDFVLLGFGIWGVVFALRRLAFSLITIVAPQRGNSQELASLVIHRARINRGPRVVAIGGGTGLPHLLAGLKKFSSNLTAVVTVADDGGSSGRLREDLGLLPPGDLRNCLVALAETEPLMGRLFQHRFEGKGGLGGHSFGNLFIAAMTEVTGDFGVAIEESSKVLAITGRVLPVTLESVRLFAELEDGRSVRGESAITLARGRVKSLSLEPASVKPNAEVLKAIAKADAIVLGPGSLYTSILPNLLVSGVAAAVAGSRALKIVACNIMTQPGETDHFRVSDHLRALQDLSGHSLADYVIANSESPPAPLLAHYVSEGQQMVEIDKKNVADLGVRLVRARLLENSMQRIRHDPDKLARAIMRLIII
jgi:uncharacterized cofD-like protein